MQQRWTNTHAYESFFVSRIFQISAYRHGYCENMYVYMGAVYIFTFTHTMSKMCWVWASGIEQKLFIYLYVCVQLPFGCRFICYSATCHIHTDVYSCIYTLRYYIHTYTLRKYTYGVCSHECFRFRFREVFTYISYLTKLPIYIHIYTDIHINSLYIYTYMNIYWHIIYIHAQCGWNPFSSPKRRTARQAPEPHTRLSTKWGTP